MQDLFSMIPYVYLAVIVHIPSQMKHDQFISRSTKVINQYRSLFIAGRLLNVILSTSSKVDLIDVSVASIPSG